MVSTRTVAKERSVIISTNARELILTENNKYYKSKVLKN